MNSLSSEALRKILGDIDDNTLTAIQESGAKLQDVIDAKALADGKSDIVGQGEQVIPGQVKQVLTILLASAR
jgi:hypothetical protein